MKRAAFAVALCMASMGALAQEAPAKVYVMMSWQQVGAGAGEIRVWGPITPAMCKAAYPTVAEHLSKDVPPDLQLGVHTCAPPLQLQTYVAAFHCVAVDHSRTPKSEAQVWLYRCLGA